MKKNKNVLLISLIYAILFAVYNLVIFFSFSIRTKVFWVSYGFMVAAIIIQAFSMFLSFKDYDIETVFLGIPLASLSIYYLFAELFCSLSFMFYQHVGVRIAVIIQVLLLAVYVIVAIISLMSKDVVRKANSQVKENVNFIRSVLVDVELLIENCKDMDLKAKLKKLHETVKYSDPMTSPVVEEVEVIIIQKLSEIRVWCDSERMDDAKKACLDLEMLFIERNKKIFNSK